MKKLQFWIFLLITQIAWSQYNEMAPWQKDIDKNSPQAFEQLENNYQKYFLTHDELAKGSGMKQYQRWKSVWQYYFTPKGFKPISIIDQAYHQKQILARNIQDNSNWTNVGPTIVNRHNESADKGRVNSVLIDPTDSQIMYVGTPAGGIWKTTNAGIDWAPLTDYLPQIGVSAIALSPTDHNTIFIGTGDDDGGVTYSRGVYKSTDGGATWVGIGPVFINESETISEIIIHPANENIILVASSDGLYKSTDGGATWHNNLNNNIRDMRMHPTNHNIVYAVSNDIFYKSTDAGETFTPISSGLPSNSLRMVIDVSPASPNSVYLAAANGTGDFNGLYVSNDAGNTFARTQETDNIFGSRNQTWYDFAIAVSDTDPNIIFIGNVDVYKSTDGGNNFFQHNSWNTVNDQYTHADIHFLRYYDGKFVAGTDGGVYVSNNDGQLFTRLNNNLAISQFYRISISQGNNYQIYGGLQDNGGYARKDMNWHVWHGADGMDTAIDSNNSDIGYSFIYYGLYLNITQTGGVTQTATATYPGVRGNWVTPLAVNSQNEVFAGFNKLYRLVNNRWQSVTSNTFSNNISTFTIDPADDNHIIVGVRDILYRSTDGGVTFSPVYTATDYIRSIAINSSLNKIWVATSNKVLESSDNGATWNDISGNLPGERKNVIKHHRFSPNNTLYLGTDLGVYYKDDTSADWQVFSQNLPNTPVRDLEINAQQGILVAATYGRGIWETPIPVYLPAKDIEVNSIVIGNNNLIECNPTQDIIIKIYNRGNDDVNHLDIQYEIDGASYNTSWNGTLTTNNFVEITVNTQNLTFGVHQIVANVAYAGDQISNNNSYESQVIMNNQQSLPYLNQFETIQTDGLISVATTRSTWELASPTGQDLNQTGGGTRAYCTSASGNYLDSSFDYLYSPCYDFTNFINPSISFNMAYKIERDWDAFYVEYSTDNGVNWQLLGLQTDPNWYNNSTVQGVCHGNQWTGTNTNVTNYSHDLSFLTNENSVIFRFVMASDLSVNEEGVMLDDLQISGAMSVDQNNIDNSVMLFPNPATENTHVKWHEDLSVKSVVIYNVQGRMVYHNEHSLQGNQMQINTSNFAKGMYFVNINTPQNKIVKKLIVK